MINKYFQVCAVPVLLVAAGLAQAEVAQIISINGSAVVERASYKYAAQRGMILEEGDVVRSLKGNVKLKYDNCESYVSTHKEVVVSINQPCAPAKLAKASDLKAIENKSYKIQRIDSNLAEAACTACKVDLNKVAVPLSGVAMGRIAAGVIGIAALAGASNSSGSSTRSLSEN